MRVPDWPYMLCHINALLFAAWLSVFTNPQNTRQSKCLGHFACARNGFDLVVLRFPISNLEELVLQ